MKDAFETLLEKKDKALHDKMLIKAVYLIAALRQLNDRKGSILNDIYCELERKAEEMEGE